MPPPKHDDVAKAQILTLVASGHTMRQVAEDFGVGQTSIIRWRKAAETAGWSGKPTDPLQREHFAGGSSPEKKDGSKEAKNTAATTASVTVNGGGKKAGAATNGADAKEKGKAKKTGTKRAKDAMLDEMGDGVKDGKPVRAKMAKTEDFDRLKKEESDEEEKKKNDFVHPIPVTPATGGVTPEGSDFGDEA